MVKPLHKWRKPLNSSVRKPQNRQPPKVLTQLQMPQQLRFKQALKAEKQLLKLQLVQLPEVLGVLSFQQLGLFDIHYIRF